MHGADAAGRRNLLRPKQLKFPPPAGGGFCIRPEARVAGFAAKLLRCIYGFQKNAFPH